MTQLHTISFQCEHTQVEGITDTLESFGALSITYSDAHNEALYQTDVGESPLWQVTRITAYFSLDTDIDAVTNTLLSIEDMHIETQTIAADQDWVTQTQERFPPQCFGERLWVIPSWTDSSHFNGPLIRINPGLAFGTGCHPTTALCLRWIAQRLPLNCTVLDYGCGSGILSLAALSAGARAATAVDHDPLALFATHNNRDLNPEFAQRLSISTPQNTPIATFDVIIANILLNPLITLAPQIKQHAHSGTALILSGVLRDKIDRLITTYGQLGFVAIRAEYQEEWAMIHLSYRASNE